MNNSMLELSRQAMHLPRSERFALAKRLLDVDDSSDDSKIEALWHSEILNRAQAVEEGVAQGCSYDETLRKVDAALNR
ncbi:MAG: addiction module protein [Opitutales bacterium]|nr:addiction module protein [Opitutales bacterium]